MAGNNKNLIVAFFANERAAEMAADGLKDWDDACRDIKLGGIGIITREHGEIKSRMVGGRAAGEGAKWGTILGVTAGIFSGGLTIIGGALAGLLAGAVAGAFFHKRLGMTDDDKAHLDDHLKGGGAAIAVIAGEDAVSATTAELVSMGGKVENFSVSHETFDVLEKANTASEI
jgi:uncharacterized membrane protein